MAATPGVKPAIMAKFYRNTGSYVSPTLTSVDLVRDGTLAAPWDLADASARVSRAKMSSKTQVDLTATLAVRADNSDAGYIALIDAALSPDGIIDGVILDGAYTVEGSRGARAHWNVVLDSQDQAIGNIIYSNFTLKPAPHADGYASKAVASASGVMTYTAY